MCGGVELQLPSFLSSMLDGLAASVLNKDKCLGHFASCMMTLCCLKTLRFIYPLRHNIPEKWNPKSLIPLNLITFRNNSRVI